MKRYIRTSESLFLPYPIEYDIEEIIKYLDEGKKVFIENGSLNDQILDYSISKGASRLDYDTVLFYTTGATQYFGDTVDLTTFDHVYCDEYKDCLCVEVS